jgi:hypothetical protein
MSLVLQKLLTTFYSRPKRERLLVVGALSAILIWGAIELTQAGISNFGGQKDRITERSRELAKLQYSVAKYAKLSTRLANLENTYANSELSVEQVYSEVEGIVKGALSNKSPSDKGSSSDGYELRSVGAIVSISDSVQQQGYTLKLKSLTLAQLVDLLYRLEQGKAPLFLGRLEITKGSQQGIFSANLELSSLRRKRSSGG